METGDLKKADVEIILNRLNAIEDRVSALESGREHARNSYPSAEEDEDAGFADLHTSIGVPLESNLGEYGLAWLGNIVLFFAIVFLWQYFNDSGMPLMSLVVGCISVAGVFVLSHFLKKSFSYLASMFYLFGFIILYYIVLRLHFFNEKPLLTDWMFTAILLLIISAVQFFFAVKRHSQVLAGLAFTMAVFTAYICSRSLVFFLVNTATTGFILYLFLKYNWWRVVVYALCISFLVNLFWLLDNPVSLIKTPDNLTYHYAFVYFSMLTALYSLLALRKSNGAFPDHFILTTILLSGIFYSVLLFAMVSLHFPSGFVPFFIAISIYGISYSVILKLYSPWQYSPALYSLFGFVAISVSVFGIYHFPDAFLLLICQSFLVLVLALWYRSYIITLINTLLMATMVILYYNLYGNILAVNFAIPVVAFLSARIINWQKERLHIKTDFIRNIYLFILFFTLLFATYKALPGQYITVSWLLVAAIYFGLSILLKSFKYRWMAMGNLLIAAFYLFLIDLAKIDLIYRILIFLAFAVTTIVISTYYARKLKHKSEESGI